MDKIDDNFLRYASEILGEGLSGGQITKYFLKRSVLQNINVPFSAGKFEDENGRWLAKKEAIYQNLRRFSPQSQYQIILEVCNTIIRPDFSELHDFTIERYGDLFGSGNQPVPSTVKVSVPVSKPPQIVELAEHTSSPDVKPSQPFEIKPNINDMAVFPVPPLPPKPWYTKPEYFVPIIVALIGGFFLIWAAFIKQEKPAPGITSANDQTYEITLIDHKTFKTPVFTIANPKIKVYHTSPPTVITVVDGTAKFDSDPTSMENPVLVEFENVKNYSFVDRKQTLKPGKNDVLVVSKK